MSKDVLAQVNQQTDDAAVSVEALTGMRKVIAERLSSSWQTSPHVNMTAEVDMSKAIDLKAQLAASGQKVSVTDIIVKCTAIALTEFPLVNASLINNEIIQYKHVNIGIAVALDNGLIVPVIKDANHKTITALRNDLLMLSDKARTGRLTSDEMSQGTFTISNLGMFGVDHFTPIINPPQSAILGVCRTVERPVAVDGQVVVKPLMNLCLSFDHRLIDGVDGAKFLARIRALLEQPLLLL
jgi:pyruvate dehydrogenase E2 component (dihydrolipoamide acetyltransferase)